MYMIEKGIDVPMTAGGGGTRPKYPWDDMEVGDSFFVPHRNGRAPKLAMTSMSRLCNMRARLHGGKFCVRTVGGGVRVWRVA